MVSCRDSRPHQLLGVAGSISGNTVLCKTQPEYYHSNEIGQCHSSDKYQQARRNTFASIMPASSDNLVMVLEAQSRILPRKGQCSSRSRIKDHCDWKLNTQIFSQIQLQMDKFVCVQYSWRLDPEVQNTDEFDQNWSQLRGFAFGV